MNESQRSRRSVSWRHAVNLVACTVMSFFAAGQECLAYQAPATPKKSNTEKQVEALVEQARLRLKSSEWDAAIKICDQALKVLPKNGPALLCRGQAFNGLGAYDKAIKDLDLATAIVGRDPEAVSVRADAYSHRSVSLYQKGEYLKAIDSAYFALLEKGDHVEAHTNRAMAYLARNQHDKAITSLNRVIAINAKSAEAYSNRGYAYGAKGNLNQAIADQNKALELQPNLALAYQRRGSAYALKGDPVKAFQDFEKALSLKRDAETLCDRAYLHGMRGDMRSANADISAALQLNPRSAKAHFLKGLTLLERSEHSAAISSFNEAIRYNAGFANAYCFRGIAHMASQNNKDALADLNKAIELDPKLAKAYSNRATVHRKLRKFAEADADLAKVKELTPPPPPKVVKAPKPRKGVKVVKAPARKPEQPKKKDDPLMARFLVSSKPVDPTRRSQVLQSAAQIDRLVAAGYAKHNVQPNPRTTDEQFVRRIYLDITGTIPTYPQTRKFLSSRDPDKRSQLIDELLGSDGYASHSYNYWADVLRYTDSLNTNVRGEPYRQWIKQSLAENKPWDKMVDELLTAEGLIWKNPATGYLQRDSGMPLDNMNNTVRIFLGTRIGCAQCHNHPFDRWTQKEFYQMAAFTFPTVTRTGGTDKRFWNSNPNDRLQEEYSSIEQEEEDRRNNSYRFNRLVSVNMMIVNDQRGRKIRLPKDYAYQDAKPGEVIEPKTLFGKSADLRTGESPRKAFSRWMTSKDNPRFALTIANRLWKQAFGIGMIEPVDDMMDSTVAENPALMNFLESEMKRLDFNMKEYLRIVFNTETYQRQASVVEVRPGETYHFPGPILRRMSAEQVWDSFLTLAVKDPDEFRELPADVRTKVIGVNLSEISAKDMLDAEFKRAEIDAGLRTRETKYKYKGVLLARASELPSPVPAGHFLRVFGQSDRELISTSSTQGSVPQVLFMFNGPISHMLLEKNSTIYNNVVNKRSVPDRVSVIFLSILNREPDAEEAKLAIDEIDANGAAGYGNVIWSLVNTREFLFIQ